MHRFVLTDAQWAKMEPLCLGKPTDPGRSGSDNRMFLEEVLWIDRTGSPQRDLHQMIRTWSSLWSTRQSSKFTATRSAQKGDQKSGHRQIKGWLDHQDPRADRRARESGAVHPAARPSL